MSDIRALRLAVEQKLEDRRRLLTENSRLKDEVGSLNGELDFTKAVLKNGYLSNVVEHCADQLVNEIISKAIEASRLVTQETHDRGGYEIGIDMPSLHIRQFVMNDTLRDIYAPSRDAKPTDIAFRRVGIGLQNGKVRR
jgi:hypothetical protein